MAHTGLYATTTRRWEIFGGPGHTDDARGWDEIAATMIVLHRGAELPSVEGMRCPRIPFGEGLLDQIFTTWWGQWEGVAL